MADTSVKSNGGIEPVGAAGAELDDAELAVVEFVAAVVVFVVVFVVGFVVEAAFVDAVSAAPFAAGTVDVATSSGWGGSVAALPPEHAATAPSSAATVTTSVRPTRRTLEVEPRRGTTWPVAPRADRPITARRRRPSRLVA
jgi:hypothetical protein